jgi:2-polyprenyl-3-methyl-5-hydroxy-6-metoxy-1,4-benzoquinol methylase
MTLIKKFYDRTQFPGHYSLESIELQSQYLTNRYLKLIDKYLDNHQTVLDVGCGTGVITNIFARRYPNSQFVGMDFADSIDYARSLSKNNTTFIKQNFLEFEPVQQFDCVICQGVLHHIPEASEAIQKLKNSVKPGGKLILGLYHPMGKLAKKYFSVDYGNCTLHCDQEENPYEISYSLSDVVDNFSEFILIDAVPGRINISISIAVMALFNFKNGGLVTYILEKTAS